jgi:radical SAM protein with 4Fe4S-binding SPASM domain
MLSLYLKPTNYCNIDCEHCYLPESVRAEKLMMDDEALRKTARFAKDLKEREGHAGIHFIWHGGEPLVLTPAYYWRANEILKEEMAGVPFTQSLQTSLIPYTEKWSALIGEMFEGHIGSSVDFTQRSIKSSPGAYLELWLDKVRLARSHGHFVLPGMVPTRHEAKNGAEILNWFVDNGFHAFNVDRFSQYGSSTLDWPSNREHSGFLIGLFDGMIESLKTRGWAPAVNVLAAGIQGVILGMSGDRWGTRCQREFLVVEPDGSLNTCPDRAKHEAPYSNIADGIDALISSPSRRNWIRVMDVTHKESHCHTCEFRHFCKSGCPITPNGPANGQAECAGYKTFLLHVQAYVEAHPEDRTLLLEYAVKQHSQLDRFFPADGGAHQ